MYENMMTRITYYRPKKGTYQIVIGVGAKVDNVGAQDSVSMVVRANYAEIRASVSQYDPGQRR